MLKKYNLSVLMAFLMLIAVSCQKGGEPVPYSKDSNVTEGLNIVNDNRNVVSDMDNDSENGEEGAITPEGDQSDDSDPNDGGTVIGGDDNEDDDDGDNVVGGRSGDNNGGDDDGVGNSSGNGGS